MFFQLITLNAGLILKFIKLWLTNYSHAKKIQKIKNERAREDCESEREHLFCSLGFFGRLQKSSYSTVIKIVCTSITHGRFFWSIREWRRIMHTYFHKSLLTPITKCFKIRRKAMKRQKQGKIFAFQSHLSLHRIHLFSRIIFPFTGVKINCNILNGWEDLKRFNVLFIFLGLSVEKRSVKTALKLLPKILEVEICEIRKY